LDSLLKGSICTYETPIKNIPITDIFFFVERLSFPIVKTGMHRTRISSTKLVDSKGRKISGAGVQLPGGAAGFHALVGGRHLKAARKVNIIHHRMHPVVIDKMATFILFSTPKRLQ
jgi:hypothetical protein